MRFDPERYTSADAIRSPRLKWLRDYWLGKAPAPGVLPARAALDPIEMKPVLSHVMVIEVVAGRFRYRLVGTEVVASAGYDFTGEFLDDQDFANRDFYLGCYRDIVVSKQPVFGLDHWVYADGRHGIAEFMMLPLTLDGVTVGQILTIEDNLVTPVPRIS
jgi:hypothetical protein